MAEHVFCDRHRCHLPSTFRKEIDLRVRRTRVVVMTITLSTKGQIVVPSEIRAKLGLVPGCSLSCEIDATGRIVLDPLLEERKAEVIGVGDDIALVAPEGSPEMSPRLVKEILSEI